METSADFAQERNELERVLSSGIFHRAPNLALLLTYVCSRYFEGAGDQIKEYNIAVDALGRPADFDQKRDSIVRVEAHRLRKRLRENLESERRHQHEHAEKEKLVDQLVAANEFPVPEALIQDQIDTRLERGFRALASQGMRPQDMRKLNLSRLREAQKDAAVREVKAALLLEKVADAEKIETSEEDLQRELEMVALQTRQPVETIRERLEKDGSLARIKHRIRNEKALDFLYGQSA